MDGAVSIKTEMSEVVGRCEASLCLKTEPPDDDEFSADAGPILCVPGPRENHRHLSRTGKTEESSEGWIRRGCDLRCGKKSSAVLELEPREDDESSTETKLILSVPGACEDQQHLSGTGESEESSEEQEILERSLRSENKPCAGGKRYLCEICGKSYMTQPSLKGHQSSHFPIKLMACCSVCGKRFQTANSLNRHKLIHTKGKAFQCDICGKSFTQKATVKVHQRIHTGEKPYVCRICFRGFHQNSILKAHYRRNHVGGSRASKKRDRSSHYKNEDQKPTRRVCIIKARDAMTPLNGQRHDKKPYRCDICARDFLWPSRLEIHFRSHINDRPFTCNVCDDTFLQKGHLKNHYERVHMKLPRKRSSAKLNCHFCGKAFLYPSQLKLHLTIHTNEKAFCCEICGKAYTRKTSLQLHQWTHTDKRPFNCRVCREGFIRKCHLRDHMRVSHVSKRTKRKKRRR